jgi:hypothetical protein
MVLMAALLYVPVFKLNAQMLAEIMTNSEVQATWQAIKTNAPHLIEEQIRVCEIASTFDSQSVQTIFCNWSQA